MTNSKKQTDKTEPNVEFPGYTPYPAGEDIYEKFKEESEIDPEDISQKKQPIEISGTKNEKDFDEDVSGSDLDIPGAELDDASELIGNEDEENNYYSLGGDNHNDLEEDNNTLLSHPLDE